MDSASEEQRATPLKIVKNKPIDCVFCKMYVHHQKLNYSQLIKYSDQICILLV